MFNKEKVNEKEKKVLNYIINNLENINDFNHDIQYKFVELYPFMIKYIKEPTKDMIMFYVKQNYQSIDNYQDTFTQEEILNILINCGSIKDYNLLSIEVINKLLDKNSIKDIDRDTYTNIMKYFVDTKQKIDIEYLISFVSSDYIVFSYNELFSICTNNQYSNDELGYLLSRLYNNKKYYLINELIKTALFNNQEVLSHFIMNGEDLVRLPFNLSENAVSNLIQDYKNYVDIEYLLPYPKILIEYINNNPAKIKSVPEEYICSEMIDAYISNIEYFNFDEKELHFKNFGNMDVNLDSFKRLLSKNVLSLYTISNITKEYIDCLTNSEYIEKDNFLFKFSCREDIDQELRDHCIKELFKIIIEKY